MVKRLLLDRIDAETAGAAVGRQNDLAAFAGPDEAKPALAFMELAITRAEITLQAAIVQGMPVLGANCRFHRSVAFPVSLTISLYCTRGAGLRKNPPVDEAAEV